MRGAERDGKAVVEDQFTLDYVKSFTGVDGEDLFEFEALAEGEEFYFLVLTYPLVQLPPSLSLRFRTNTLCKH